jgi:hypothetical protein
MTELDTTAVVETEDFTDELCDEALDREEGRACPGCAASGACFLTGS